MAKKRASQGLSGSETPPKVIAPAKQQGTSKFLKMLFNFQSVGRLNAACPEKSKAASSMLQYPKHRAGSISYRFVAQMLRSNLCSKPVKSSVLIWGLRILPSHPMAKNIQTRSILQNTSAILRSFSVSSPEKQRGAQTGTKHESGLLVCMRKFPTAVVIPCRSSPLTLFERTI